MLKHLSENQIKELESLLLNELDKRALKDIYGGVDVEGYKEAHKTIKSIISKLLIEKKKC